MKLSKMTKEAIKSAENRFIDEGWIENYQLKNKEDAHQSHAIHVIKTEDVLKIISEFQEESNPMKALREHDSIILAHTYGLLEKLKDRIKDMIK